MNTSEETEVSFLFTSGLEEVLSSQIVNDETSDGTVDLELLAENSSGDT